MTNFEKYKDTILEIVNMGADIAKKNGRIITCDRILCSECDFSALHSDGHCIANMFEWLYSDGSITLTKRERAFCEYMDGGYIARDMSGDLYWHNYKPENLKIFGAHLKTSTRLNMQTSTLSNGKMKSRGQ